MSAPGGYETTVSLVGNIGQVSAENEVLPYAVSVAVGGPQSGYGRHGRKYTFGAPIGHTTNRNLWTPAWRSMMEDSFVQLVSTMNTAALPWIICSFARHTITPVTVIRAVPEIAVLGRRLKLNS
jgi:ribosome modulation factor